MAMTTTGKALETLLEMCEESNASDLHLATGLPPRFRIKGSLLARNDLRAFEAADVDRISMIVGKHHTYNAPIPEIDFRILLEADACVNVYEKDESDQAKKNIYKNIFRTETGKKIYTTMFDLKMDI